MIRLNLLEGWTREDRIKAKARRSPWVRIKSMWPEAIVVVACVIGLCTVLMLAAGRELPRTIEYQNENEYPLSGSSSGVPDKVVKTPREVETTHEFIIRRTGYVPLRCTVACELDIICCIDETPYGSTSCTSLSLKATGVWCTK